MLQFEPMKTIAKKIKSRNFNAVIVLIISQ